MTEQFDASTSVGTGVGREAQELARAISDLIWSTYDDQFGYASGKRVENACFGQHGYHPENIWSFWSQFDPTNQRRFGAIVYQLPPTTPAVRELVAWIETRGED